MIPIFNTKANTRVGTCNVRTLFQCGLTDQVLKTMRDYRLDILGISEMRWTGQGRLMIDGATVLSSGKQDHHTHGVGLILSSCTGQALVGWRPVNECIIYTRHAKVTIVQVYAPTEVASEEEKDIFYTQLQGVLEEIPSYDIKLLIGDFNAKLHGGPEPAYPPPPPGADSQIPAPIGANDQAGLVETGLKAAHTISDQPKYGGLDRYTIRLFWQELF
ncbi:hypothetical protein AAFF_G00193920 [Aldrovandia affinis]|uniref:Endonuclease/exonuclease/phosphatase domain-containing protein n=1 Tax=Aldrovandia affinis TaxID=143900 RepID=A0AAD7WVH9_9TELE|nr:hypothetical protein AAFF_G00193920 [Aldrovandia affinis]